MALAMDADVPIPTLSVWVRVVIVDPKSNQPEALDPTVSVSVSVPQEKSPVEEVHNNLEAVPLLQLLSPAPRKEEALTKDEKVDPEVTVSDEPIPTLPVRSDIPLTLKPPEEKVNPVVVKEPPIPALPEVVKVEAYPVPSTLVPVTFKLVNAAVALVAVAVNDPPIPTLPETLNDDPIPTKPVNSPVPATFRL